VELILFVCNNAKNTKMTALLTENAQKYVTARFAENQNHRLIYHNLDHTLNVVNACKKIAGKCGISGIDLEMLVVAAWFHDVGYLSKLNNHEEASALEARSFLSKNVADEAFIRQVENCILATKIPQDPHDTLSAILCDADLFHVSQPDFLENVHFFWDEIKALNGIKQPDSFYLENTLRFFEAHHFKTNYGQTILDPGKKENMERVRRTLQKLKK
jgi:predicted metal-dependent HD superfamily phosphohydrolase